MSKFITEITSFICRTSSEMTEFTRGMNDVGGLWDLVLKRPSIWKPLFCHQTEAMGKQAFEALCQVDYSEEGSNRRHQEDATIYAWELFLQDVAGNLLTIRSVQMRTVVVLFL